MYAIVYTMDQQWLFDYLNETVESAAIGPVTNQAVLLKWMVSL